MSAIEKQLQSELQRVWKAFCAANSTLKIMYDEDKRGVYSREEADCLVEWMSSAERERLHAQLRLHLTAFPLDGKSRCPECTAKYHHSRNCTRQ